MQTWIARFIIVLFSETCTISYFLLRDDKNTSEKFVFRNRKATDNLCAFS